VLCSLFGLPASTYYEQEQRRDRIDGERIHLRATVAALFNASNQSAGSRTLVFQLALMGLMVGRYKVSRLMEEAGLCQRRFKTDPLIGDIASLKLTHPWRLSVA